MGKAKRFNSYDSAVAEGRKVVENYGQIRQSYAGITSSLSSAPKGRTLTNKNSNKLSLQHGGEINSPIGFTADTSAINSSNVLDISLDFSGNPKNPRGLIFVSSATSTTLDEIIGKKYSGQLLFLTGISGQSGPSAITITHASGNAGQILCPDDTNYTLSNDESVILIDDVTAGTQTWRIIAVSKASSGADNLGNHTATQNLNMAGYDITNFDDIIGNTGDKYVFDGSSTYMTGSTTTSGRVNIYNNGVNVTSFLTSGILTKDIDIDGNTLYLDSDGDSSIESFTDDTINFNTSSSNRMSISNSSINMNNPLNMFSNDISGIKVAEFNNTGIPSSSQTGIGSTTGDMYYNALTNDSHFFRINGTTEVEIDADGIDIRNGWLELEERTAPSGLSNHARIYAKDNGSGKTQLVVIFGSGAEQVIATEP